MHVRFRQLARLLSASVLVLMAGVSDVSAQPPPPAHEITVCVHDHADTSGYFTDPGYREGTIGDGEPTSASPVGDLAVPNWAVHTRRLMSTFVECSLQYAQTDIVPRVLPWFNGILTIMVVWTAVTVMFSGSVSVATLLPFLMMAAFASGLMHTYYSPSPVLNLVGFNQGLSHTVLLGAEVISETLFEQADIVYYTKFDEARTVVVERNALLITSDGTSFAGMATRVGMLTAAGAMVGSAATPVGTVAVGASSFVGAVYAEFRDYANAAAAFLWSLIITATMWTFLGILHIAYWIIMAQYMWGYFSMAVIVVVGPLFIPLALVPQTQDYFWGWFKALVNSAFYMITAAALYVIVAAILTLPLDFLISRAAAPPTDPRTELVGIMEFATNLFMQYLPVIAMSLLAALQVGGIANSMTSGSQPPGAGLAGRMAQLGGGGMAVAGARNYVRDKYSQYQQHRAGVLSGDTRRRRQTVEQAHQAVGGGAPTSPSGPPPPINVQSPGGGSGGGPGGGTGGTPAGGSTGPVPIPGGGGPSSGPGPRPHPPGGTPVRSILRSPEFQLFERRMNQARKPAQMAKALEEYKRAILRGRAGRA